MRRLPIVLALLALSAGVLAVAVPAEAASRTISGTILGADGRAVDAFLGLDLKDASNRTIDRNGCLASSCGLHGYGITLRVNSALGPDGSTNRSAWKTTWSATVPANAAHVYIEAYPFAAGTYGRTNEHRYGHSYRRNLPVPYSARINVRLPEVCAAGGTTGSIKGTSSVAGSRARLSRVDAFSLASDNNGPTPILGWNVGTTTSSGTFAVSSLASGQKYQLIATAPDGRVKRYYGIAVSACRTATTNVTF